MQKLLEAAQAQAQQLTEDRRWLHTHAETGFCLKETAGYVARRLKEMGVTVRECGRCGWIADIGSGEDTVFIADCLRAGLKAYSYDLVLGTCAKDSSTWFSGFNEKYMFDKGAWVAAAFPRTKHLMKWYFIYRFGKKTDLPLSRVIGCFNRGIRAFATLTTFDGNTG